MSGWAAIFVLEVDNTATCFIVPIVSIGLGGAWWHLTSHPRSFVHPLLLTISCFVSSACEKLV